MRPVFAVILALLALTAEFPLRAQQIPVVTAQTLGGKGLELPSALKGRVAVLCIGFSHASGSGVKTWTNALRARFQPASGVDIYSVAVLEDAPRLVRGMILHGMKGDTPETEYPRSLVVFSKERELKQTAGFATPEDAYILVLDRDGSIRYRLHGPPTPDTVNEVCSQVTRLSGVAPDGGKP